jgi:hypothetical protein
MINIKISIGEAIDRLSILKLKLKYIKDNYKIHFVKIEIEELEKALELTGDYSKFLEELTKINDLMWNCNEIRKQKIINNQFDKDYIKLTIEDSKVKDKRFIVKNKINQLFNSELREQKSYNWIT